MTNKETVAAMDDLYHRIIVIACDHSAYFVVNENGVETPKGYNEAVNLAVRIIDGIVSCFDTDREQIRKDVHDEMNARLKARRDRQVKELRELVSGPDRD